MTTDTDTIFAIATASSPDEVPDWVPETMSGEARDNLGVLNGGVLTPTDREVASSSIQLPPGMDNYQQAAAQALAKMGKQMIDEATSDWEPVHVLSGAATILLADAMRRSDELSKAAAQLEAELHLIRAAAPMPATVVASDPEVEAHLPVEPGTNRRHSWTSFREAGMLWCVNRVLHIFGWAIVIEVDDATGMTTGAFPVRTEWRGFPRDREDLGYERTSAWMAKAGAAIREETGRK